MNFGSKKCWIKPRAQTTNDYKIPEQPLQMWGGQHGHDEQDTNIVTIEFDNLKEAEENMQIGDPIYCSGCKVLLNQRSKVEKVSKKQNEPMIIEQQPEEEEEESKISDNTVVKQVPSSAEENNDDSHTMIWKCEFCNTVNPLNIEIEEIPQKDDVVYLLQSGHQKIITSTSSDTAVVFAIDISGSMSVTVPLKQSSNKNSSALKHSTKVSQEEFEMLKQFMDAEDIAQYMNMQADQTSEFVSRKQCILAAIQQQLEDLSESDPSKRVCLITFNNEVTIYGGGSYAPIVITGDKLYSAEEIERIASANSAKMLEMPVCEAKQKLIEIFDGIKEMGQTALGPALLASIALLAGAGDVSDESHQSAKGSSIILCTDGLANIGVGSFEESVESTTVFYSKVGAKAAESDIVFNVVSIKGEGCKLDVLGNIADLTGGNVLRVDPDNLHKDFANILKDEVVGLKAQMTVYLSKQMKFRNVDETVDKVDTTGSKCVKYIGNITKTTISTFEYTRKSDAEAAEQGLQELDESVKELPFQAQITYKNIAGHQMMRVITKMQEITFEKEVAQKNSNQTVIRQHVSQHTAQLIQQNNYGMARKFNKGWENYIGSSAFGESEQSEFNSVNRQLKTAARQKQVNFSKKQFPEQNMSLQNNNDIANNVSLPQAIQLDCCFSSSSSIQQLQQQQAPISSMIPMNQMQIYKEQEQEEMFSGEENDEQDDDDCEAIMYQAKKKK